jgi:hypothetical protein
LTREESLYNSAIRNLTMALATIFAPPYYVLGYKKSGKYVCGQRDNICTGGTYPSLTDDAKKAWRYGSEYQASMKGCNFDGKPLDIILIEA